MAGPAKEMAIAAHRGGGGLAPENTIPAIEQVVASGVAEWVEIDVHRSRDGHLIVCHDANVLRTTDFSGDRPQAMISDIDLDELRALDAGGWFDPRYAGAQLPLFREVLELVGGRAAMMIELKSPERYPGIAADIAAELTATGAAAGPESVALWSSDPAVLQELHDHVPEHPKGLFVRHVRSDELEPYLPMLSGVGAWPQITAHDVEVAHGLGLQAVAATFNSVPRVQAARAAGVDVLLTDYPGVVRQHLQGNWRPGPIRFDPERTPEPRWSDGRVLTEVVLRLDDSADEAYTEIAEALCLRRLGGERVEVIDSDRTGANLSVLVELPANRPGVGPLCLALHGEDGEVMDVIEHGDIPVPPIAEGMLSHA